MAPAIADLADFWGSPAEENYFNIINGVLEHVKAMAVPNLGGRSITKAESEALTKQRGSSQVFSVRVPLGFVD